MPESPCSNCGESIVVHTDDDLQPLCDLCEEARIWWGIIRDIVNGVSDFDLDPYRDENGLLDKKKFQEAFFPGRT